MYEGDAVGYNPSLDFDLLYSLLQSTSTGIKPQKLYNRNLFSNT